MSPSHLGIRRIAPSTNIAAESRRNPAALSRDPSPILLKDVDLMGRAQILLDVQRRAGNHVASMLANSRPRPAGLAEIAERADRGRSLGMTIVEAGTAKPKDPPGGLAWIQTQYTQKPRNLAPGITMIQNAVAFTRPSLDVTVKGEKTGRHTREFKATVAPTSTNDVEHESYYPAKGYHAIGTGKDRHFVFVSDDARDWVNAGETEHLGDTARAFELGYGAIAKAINAVAARTTNQPFVSSRNPAEAEQMAGDAVANGLPSVLGQDSASRLDPNKWVRLMDALLIKSKERDVLGWHWAALKPTAEKYEGRDVELLDKSTWTKIGEKQPSEFVVYPSSI